MGWATPSGHVVRKGGEVSVGHGGDKDARATWAHLVVWQLDRGDGAAQALAGSPEVEDWSHVQGLEIAAHGEEGEEDIGGGVWMSR